jgi:stage II sporulation protein D
MKRALGCITALAFWAAGCAPADPGAGEIYFPQQEPGGPGSVSWSPVDEVRVQVFPHLDRYTQPVGGEPAGSSIRFETPGRCWSYPAFGGPESSGGSSWLTTAAGRELAFSPSSSGLPAWVECDSPATLVREGDVDAIRYAGRFHVSRHPRGLRVVNVIGLEEYLRGVVPAESMPSWDAGALQAQAIAARTFAQYEALVERAKPGYAGIDFDDTIAHQAYLGLSRTHERTDDAIRGTAGRILVSGGGVISAYFAADHAGHSEDAEHVWGRALPYAVGKQEPFEAGLIPESAWHAETTLAKLQAAVGGGKADAAPPARVLVPEGGRWPSGRARIVRFVYADGKTRDHSADQLRSALRLRSTHFELAAGAGGAVRIDGRGNGHGVGLSQWGAQILASRMGWPAERILTFYYTGVRVCREHRGMMTFLRCD